MAERDPLALYADTIRVDGWCLRSALVRYAQPEPARATRLHALMRRLDAALLVATADRRAELVPVVALFEDLAVVMATWADDRARNEDPSPRVDAVVAEAEDLFERLGVPEEDTDPALWRGMRSGEGRRARVADRHPPELGAHVEEDPPAPRDQH